MIPLKALKGSTNISLPFLMVGRFLVEVDLLGKKKQVSTLGLVNEKQDQRLTAPA
jgi:hypothetical protein